jgi:hypothetical protein
MKAPVRKFKQVVFKGHGFSAKAKSTEETDIVLNDEKHVEDITRSLILYLMVDGAKFPKLTINHPSLKNKEIIGMGADDGSESIIVFVK